MSFDEFENLFSHECIIDLVNIINKNALITSPNVANLLTYALTTRIQNPKWEEMIIENNLQKIDINEFNEGTKDEIFEGAIEGFDMTKIVKILKKDINTWTPRAHVSFNNFVNAGIKKGLELTENRVDPENIRELIENKLLSKKEDIIKRFEK
jgi:hypothetical protein